MAMFRLKKGCGNHIGPPDKKGKRITYKACDKVPSKDDLVEKWPKKFEKLSAFSDDEAPVSTSPDIPAPSSKKGKKKSTEYKDMDDPNIKTPDDRGTDVSDAFPTAAKVKLQVFEKSKWFTVIDPDNGEVLNEKKLRRDKVESFLAEYLPDEEDDADEDNTDDEPEDEDNDDDIDDDDDDDEDEE